MFHYFNLWHLAPAYVDQCKNFKNNSKKKKLSIYLLNLLSRKEKRTKQKKNKTKQKKKSEYDFNAQIHRFRSSVKVTNISAITWSLDGMVRELIVIWGREQDL